MRRLKTPRACERRTLAHSRPLLDRLVATVIVAWRGKEEAMLLIWHLSRFKIRLS